MPDTAISAPTCTFHPDRVTYRSCSRCGRPACPDCLVDAAVGAHCTDCVRAGRPSAKVAAARDVKALRSVRPSPVFAVVVGAFVASCAWAWSAPAAPENLLGAAMQGGSGTGLGSSRFAIFALVLSGWVLSLCLHEFGHAFVAFIGGDRTVAAKGYLTLDPRKYTDRNLSLVLPLVFLFLGGIGLPGGAVWINHSYIRSKHMESLTSLAGPAANIAFGMVLGLPFVVARDTVLAHPTFAFGLAFLCGLQFFAALLNLLPIPGLDGFGVIEPYLSVSARRSLAPVRQYGFFILFIVIFRVPAVANWLWDTALRLADLVNVPGWAFVAGQELFQILHL